MSVGSISWKGSLDPLTHLVVAPAGEDVVVVHYYCHYHISSSALLADCPPARSARPPLQGGRSAAAVMSYSEPRAFAHSRLRALVPMGGDSARSAGREASWLPGVRHRDPRCRARTRVGMVRGKVLRDHTCEGTVRGLRVDRLVIRPAAHTPRPRSSAVGRRCAPRARVRRVAWASRCPAPGAPYCWTYYIYILPYAVAARAAPAKL
jgi:hypothetical protein